MYVLRIEYAVADCDRWKKAFDSDPAGRKKSGVRQYQVMRPVDCPNDVMIDLSFSFDTAKEVEDLIDSVRAIWGAGGRHCHVEYQGAHR